MHIIEHIGIQLKHERAKDLVREHGGSVDSEAVATIPQAVVERCIDEVPSAFTWHAKNQDRSVEIGGNGSVIRAPGYGPASVRTYLEGRQDATLSDFETFMKLIHVEDVITCAGFNVCEPTDVPQARRHAEMLKRSLLLTDKPVMGSTYGEDAARMSLNLARIAMEDPDLTDPYIAGLINTVPPRGIGADMLGALLAYAENGQPLIISSFTMAGASGPSSLAASMAQVNAENLTGITLAQLANPGTPIVYGVPSSNIDARHGTLMVGSPESALFVSFAGQMGRYYDIPTRAGGGLTDAKTVDYQSGLESMFIQFATETWGIDFVLNAVGILESYSTISPEKFILDCEALRYLDRFRAGITVDADGFPFELMTERGPAGHFLDEHGEHDTPDEPDPVLDTRSYREWADNGAQSAFEAAHHTVQQRLADYERPTIDPRIEARLEAYVANAAPESN